MEGALHHPSLADELQEAGHPEDRSGVGHHAALLRRRRWSVHLPKMMAEAPGVSSAPIIRPNGEPATREIGMVRAPRRRLPPHVRRTLHHIVAQANRVR